jgi:hypothetical protein
MSSVPPDITRKSPGECDSWVSTSVTFAPAAIEIPPPVCTR